MPRVSYELRSRLPSSRLVRRSIASSARCGIDAWLFAAECGSSGDVGRGGLAEVIGTTGSTVDFVFRPFRSTAGERLI
jgi:hypothetical protein